MKLNSYLGLDVWVARNDRNRTHNGANFQDIPHLRRELPRQFDDATNKTIELIDVLWLESDAIIAAIKVEHTTAWRLVCTFRSKSMCLFEEEFDVFLIAEARSGY